MTVGILALQGAFREHAQALADLGVPVREIRQRKDIDNISRLIIPGGESTTMGKLLNELDLLEPLRQDIADGMPVYGTCAGLILLCKYIEGSNQPRLGLLNAKVRRNAFGRQVDSFEAAISMPGIGIEDFPAVFIRAPVIMSTGPEVNVLARINQNGQSNAVAVQQNNILATSFHPELTGDRRLHEYFLNL